MTESNADLTSAIADEYLELADLLEGAPASVWDTASLCEGWRTREVVAHVTMPARYGTAEFMAEMEAAEGDFTRLSNTVAARDGALPPATLISDLRSETLHAWEPPGGGQLGALTHVVIHGLDITEAADLGRTVPPDRMTRVLASADPGIFGIDLSGVQLRADDLDWSYGSGELVTGPGQVLALVVCGRTVPAGRLAGPAAARFMAG